MNSFGTVIGSCENGSVPGRFSVSGSHDSLAVSPDDPILWSESGFIGRQKRFFRLVLCEPCYNPAGTSQPQAD